MQYRPGQRIKMIGFFRYIEPAFIYPAPGTIGEVVSHAAGELFALFNRPFRATNGCLYQKSAKLKNEMILKIRPEDVDGI